MDVFMCVREYVFVCLYVCVCVCMFAGSVSGSNNSMHVMSNMKQFYARHVKYEVLSRMEERWGAGVEYHFQEFNEPYAPS